jgi:signal transduction histidine kinase
VGNGVAAAEQVATAGPEELGRGAYLCAVMRHELFGALNSISMVAGVLAERGRAGRLELDDVLDLASRIGRQVQRATRIVDHYTEVAGLGARLEEAPGSETFSLGALVGDVARACGARVRMAGSALAGGECAPVGVELPKLRQVLGAVLGFAKLRGGRNPEIAVSALQGEEDLAIEISYHGPPVSVDSLHVFEHGTARDSSALIDVAIARRILTDAGGELSPREGRFLLRVPLLDAE